MNYLIAAEAVDLDAKIAKRFGHAKAYLIVDAETESIVARITEKKTGEVVRQIPSEDLLELKSKLEDLVGMLFDQKA